MLISLLAACDSNRLDIDVSGLDIDLQTHRFDQEMNSIDFTKLRESNEDLKEKYPEFYPVYLEEILRIGPSNELNTLQSFQGFVEDEYMGNAYELIQEKFSQETIEGFNDELEDAFKHYNYYFPEKGLPEITYCHSGFNSGIIPLDSTLGIGLDFYIGPESDPVKSLPHEIFPQYKKDKMRSYYVVPDAVRGWTTITFWNKKTGDNLLAEIIFFGKIMYCTDAFMPEVHDSLKMNYTTSELDWARGNEVNVWKEMAKQEVMFQTKVFEIKKWTEDGPFTNTGAIPEESPSRLGIWMGWQIVKDYMEENEEVTITELLDEQNFQKILKYYDPRN